MSSPAAPAAAAGPHIVALGSLPGGCCSHAFALNDHAVVVGYSLVGTGPDPVQRAFRWQNGVLTDLGTLGGTSAVATAINNNGWIAGYSTLPGTNQTHAFLWRPGLGMTDLGSLGASSLATAINDNGVVVGRYLADGRLHGFRWVDGVMTRIAGPEDVRFDPAGINKHGKMGGTVGDNFPATPATWKNGQVVASGLVGHATAVNDNGDVSGTYWDSRQGAFVWRADGTVLHLNMPAGGELASTTGINESRHTVGFRTDVNGAQRAVYWSEFGTPRLLPGLVPGGESQAWGVNRFGQAVGQAHLTASGVEQVAVLWTR